MLYSNKVINLKYRKYKCVINQSTSKCSYLIKVCIFYSVDMLMSPN